MIQEAIAKLVAKTAVETVSAHCDGPCGVYDPASARIAAEAALSMTKKIIALGSADTDSNTYSRFVSIKEEQAHLAKTELLVLWTDYFKPEHLDQCPTCTRSSGTRPSSARLSSRAWMRTPPTRSWPQSRTSTMSSGPRRGVM